MSWILALRPAAGKFEEWSALWHHADGATIEHARLIEPIWHGERMVGAPRDGSTRAPGLSSKRGATPTPLAAG